MDRRQWREKEKGISDKRWENRKKMDKWDNNENRGTRSITKYGNRSKMDKWQQKMVKKKW